jgi:hypothetical protein
MVEMARFVKPILNMTPPDPLSRNPRELAKFWFSLDDSAALPMPTATTSFS